MVMVAVVLVGADPTLKEGVVKVFGCQSSKKNPIVGASTGSTGGTTITVSGGGGPGGGGAGSWPSSEPFLQKDKQKPRKTSVISRYIAINLTQIPFRLYELPGIIKKPMALVVTCQFTKSLSGHIIGMGLSK